MQGDLKEEFKGGNERKEEIQSQFLFASDLINYKDAGNMEAYKTLLTTVTPARFKVGQMIGATGLLLGVALAMYRRVDVEQKDSGLSLIHI